jgi:hypothetical protein
MLPETRAQSLHYVKLVDVYLTHTRNCVPLKYLFTGLRVRNYACNMMGGNTAKIDLRVEGQERRRSAQVDVVNRLRLRT